MAYRKSKNISYIILGIMIAIFWLSFNLEKVFDFFQPALYSVKSAQPPGFGAGSSPGINVFGVSFQTIWTTLLCPLGLYGGKRAIDTYFDRKSGNHDVSDENGEVA